MTKGSPANGIPGIFNGAKALPLDFNINFPQGVDDNDPKYQSTAVSIWKDAVNGKPFTVTVGLTYSYSLTDTNPDGSPALTATGSASANFTVTGQMSYPSAFLSIFPQDGYSTTITTNPVAGLPDNLGNYKSASANGVTDGHYELSIDPGSFVSPSMDLKRVGDQLRISAILTVGFSLVGLQDTYTPQNGSPQPVIGGNPLVADFTLYMVSTSLADWGLDPDSDFPQMAPLSSNPLGLTGEWAATVVYTDVSLHDNNGRQLAPNGTTTAASSANFSRTWTISTTFDWQWG